MEISYNVPNKIEIKRRGHFYIYIRRDLVLQRNPLASDGVSRLNDS